jgi:hypothetical protein
MRRCAAQAKGAPRKIARKETLAAGRHPAFFEDAMVVLSTLAL